MRFAATAVAVAVAAVVAYWAINQDNDQNAGMK